VDEPLESGHSTNGNGRMSCTLHVVHDEDKGNFAQRLGSAFRNVFMRAHRKAQSKADQAVKAGDYVAAEQDLIKLVQGGEDDSQTVACESSVRASVRSLVRLAELKWRYRVVDKGESPRDAALAKLSAAMALLEAHKKHVYPEADEATEANFRVKWARELSAVMHHLAATKLVFDMAAGEASTADEIEATLHEAIALREAAQLHLELAESLNSLGMLKEKQAKYAEAHVQYERSLDLRLQTLRALQEGGSFGTAQSRRSYDDDAAGDEASSVDTPISLAKEVEKATTDCELCIAQSYVSLGKLAMLRGDGTADDEPGRRHSFYDDARGYLEDAVQAYKRGSKDEMHAKLHWTYEAQGALEEKCGNLEAAASRYELAATILRTLQARDERKELFGSELVAVEGKLKALRRYMQAPSARSSVDLGRSGDAWRTSRRHSLRTAGMSLLLGRSSISGNIARSSSPGKEPAGAPEATTTTSVRRASLGHGGGSTSAAEVDVRVVPS